MSDLVPDEAFDVAMDRLAREADLLMKPSKVLRTAADLLERGWCQGNLGLSACRIPEYGALPLGVFDFRAGVEIDRVCLMGALMKALVDLYGADWPATNYGVKAYEDRTPTERAMATTYLNTERAVEREIKQRMDMAPADTIVLAIWNDASFQTQAEVVDVVRAAAAREEEAGR